MVWQSGELRDRLYAQHEHSAGTEGSEKHRSALSVVGDAHCTGEKPRAMVWPLVARNDVPVPRRSGPYGLRPKAVTSVTSKRLLKPKGKFRPCRRSALHPPDKSHRRALSGRGSARRL